MARSRYENTRVISPTGEAVRYATYDLADNLKGYAEIDLLSGLETTSHVYALGDRLDKLANRYFGDDQYWWVIAVLNGVTNPLDVKPGRKLFIPLDLTAALGKLDIR